MRLIDADELLQKRWKAKDITDGDLYVIGQGFVMSAPTIDAAPVVHARWIHPVPGDGAPYCSNCKKYSPLWTPYYGFSDSDYCPCCGAKMDAMED